MEQDEPAIDALVAAFFSAFDNRDGKLPTGRGFEALFGPSALIVTHAASGPQVATPTAFVEPRIALLKSGELVDFHEWETESRTEIVGSLAVRRSRYAKQGTLRGAPYDGKGTKYFQFARLEQRWRIVAVSWIDDPAAA